MRPRRDEPTKVEQVVACGETPNRRFLRLAQRVVLNIVYHTEPAASVLLHAAAIVVGYGGARRAGGRGAARWIRVLRLVVLRIRVVVGGARG